MATMVRPQEALNADPVLDIMEDETLTMGEKLLLLEGLFVHDCPPPSPEHQADSAPYLAPKSRG